jgi:hypothetical protein
MTPFPQPAPAAAPAIETRQQLEVVLENIANLHRERNELYFAQEKEIGAVRQKYRAPLTEIENYLDLETSWAESWARRNPGAFAADRSLALAHGVIGFRAEPPQIERASRRWTWSRIALTLGELAWGKRYLRVPRPKSTRKRSSPTSPIYPRSIFAMPASKSRKERDSLSTPIPTLKRFPLRPSKPAEDVLTIEGLNNRFDFHYNYLKLFTLVPIMWV